MEDFWRFTGILLERDFHLSGERVGAAEERREVQNAGRLAAAAGAAGRGPAKGETDGWKAECGD